MSDVGIRIVHSADIHLDSPMLGLGRLGDDDLAAQLRGATRAAFDNLIQHCVETEPAALVIAGDLYDGDWKDYSTGVYFTNGMRDLRDAGIPVFVVQGNHDAESVISRSLTLPDNVRMLSTEGPETVLLEGAGLSFHGQGFAGRAVLENLAVDFPPPVSGLANVGILHTSVQGYAGFDPYAPCSLVDLTGRGYEYFALGHIHTRQTLANGLSTVAFSGNLQGRTPQETGAKGALDVRLRPGEVAETDFVPLDAARWESLEVDVTALTDEAQVFDLVEANIISARQAAGSRPLVVRVRLVGESPVAGVLTDAERVGAEIRPAAARHGVAVDAIRSSVSVPADRRAMPEGQRAAFDAVLSEVLSQPDLVLTDPEVKRDLDALRSEVNEAMRRNLGADMHGLLWRLLEEAVDRLRVRADGGLL